MNRLSRLVQIAACLGMLASPVLANAAPIEGRNTLRVNDGDVVQVTISRRELTRIAVEGNGRLERIWGAAGNLEIEPDEDRGEIFIRPITREPYPFSFFVRDDNGATYTILATPRDVPSQTVILSPVNTREQRIARQQWQNKPYVDQIKGLVRAMALDEPLSGFRVQDSDSIAPLWRETVIRRNKVYTGYYLVGERYTVRNTSNEELIFNEREFVNVGEGVVSVAIEHLELPPGRTTTLYIVREGEGGTDGLKR